MAKTFEFFSTAGGQGQPFRRKCHTRVTAASKLFTRAVTGGFPGRWRRAGPCVRSNNSTSAQFNYAQHEILYFLPMACRPDHSERNSHCIVFRLLAPLLHSPVESVVQKKCHEVDDLESGDERHAYRDTSKATQHVRAILQQNKRVRCVSLQCACMHALRVQQFIQMW